MIQLSRVSKVYRSKGRSVAAVTDVSLEVADGETLCLIGTSGSGKTTAMKMINRLIEPTEGEIRVDGQDVRTLDVIRLRRSLGYVIQRGGLFPHHTVAENVGLMPRLENWPAERVRARVEELLELVNLPAAQYADRYPRELSGGQQQRVGVARALALDPPHILMDEPFGALDPITRDGLQEEFLRLRREVGKTVILVTHDLAEAFRLGDRIALMHEGRLAQVGTPAEFRRRPASEFVADFLRSHLGAEVTASALLDPDVEPLRAESAEGLPAEPGPRVVVDGAGRLLGVLQDSALDREPPVLQESSTLREAVELLVERRPALIPVLAPDGAVAGAATPATILEGLGR